jgi:hypothetical protein
MNADEVYEIWAPRESAWSTWAKPILFAHISSRPQAFDAVASELEAEPSLEAAPLPALPALQALPAAANETALVIDLPGIASIAIGMAAASSAFRPIPLFNAAPAPHAADAPRAAINAVVDVWPIVEALVAATARLGHLAISPAAPPAFLLDSARRVGSRLVHEPGTFDNRSISLPTDFPSAGLLRQHGIAQVLLIQQTGNAPQSDLAHTLLRWQEAGLTMWLHTTDAPALAPRPLLVRRPARFRALWHAALATFGLRPNPLGGFGGVLPDPSAGG